MNVTLATGGEVDLETGRRCSCVLSTVAEIKAAFKRLPDRQKIKLARWLQTQIDERPNDEELMKMAAEGRARTG